MKPRPLYVKYRLLFPREITGMAASDGGDSGDVVYFHPSIIRGHHIYKDIWSPKTGEILEAARECGNRHDRRAFVAACIRGRALPPPRNTSLSCCAERACSPFWPFRFSVRLAPIAEQSSCLAKRT